MVFIDAIAVFYFREICIFFVIFRRICRQCFYARSDGFHHANGRPVVYKFLETPTFIGGSGDNFDDDSFDNSQKISGKLSSTKLRFNQIFLIFSKKNLKNLVEKF